MKGNGFIASLLTTLLLAGCGGSDDDKKEEETKVVPARLTAELAFVASRCDIETPVIGADVIVHRKDGSILSQAKSDAYGHIDIDWAQEASHLTISHKYDPANFDEAIELETYIDLAAGDLGKHYYSESALNSRCDCADFVFDTSDLSAVYNNYNVLIDGTSTNSKNFCKRQGQYDPVNIVLMPRLAGLVAYAAQVDLNLESPSQAIGLPPVMFEASQNLGAELSVSVDAADYYLRTYGESEYGRQNWLQWDNDAMIFPGLFERNYVIANHRDTMAAEEGTLYYYAKRRIRVSDPTAQQAIALPQNQVPLMLEFQRLLQGFLAGGTTSYDFSDIGQGRNVLGIRLSQNLIAEWNIQAPLKGTIPQLQLPAQLDSVVASMSQPTLDLFSYGYHLPYELDSYRKELAKLSRNPPAIRSEMFDNYEYESLTVTLD